MTTELINAPPARNGILYAVTPETIEQRAASILAMRIKGVDDEAGLTAVKSTLRTVIGWRTSVEETRKQIKAEPWALCKRIDAEAEEIQLLIAPLEGHLKSQREAVETQLRLIAKQKEDAIYAARLQRLTDAGGEMHEDTIRAMPDEAFDLAVEQAQAKTAARLEAEQKARDEEAERKRLLEEQAEANRQEQARLTAEREAFEAQQRAAQAEAARLKQIEDDKQAAEQLRLNEERQALDRQRFATEKRARELEEAETNRQLDAQLAQRKEQQRLDQIEADRLEAEARAEREREALAEAEAAAVRAEQLQPVKMRILKFAERVREMAPTRLPDDITNEIVLQMAVCADRISAIAKGLK